MEKIRIQKLLSDAGYCSRRKAEALIAAGKVKLNGHPVKLGDQATRADLITVNGEAVRIPRRKVKRYLMLYKPRGYVTTTSDELDRRCVMDLLDGVEERVYPVGRLDKNSEGLLIMTNDGEFAQKVMHPRFHLKKQYLVITNGFCTNTQADRLRAMKTLEDEPIQPVDVRICERSETSSKLMFVLSEGKNRQIRRMCEAAGLTVMQLRRIAIGTIRLGTLESGCHRNLTKDEIKELTQSK